MKDITEFSKLKEEEVSVLIKKSLKLDLPYAAGRLFNQPGPAAAVLILVSKSLEGGHFLLMTQRTSTVEMHKGQIAFPGGVQDPEDLLQTEFPLRVTALRETHEEVGVNPAQVEVLGELPRLTIPTSGFQVTPVVGLHLIPIEKTELKVSEAEIEEAFWVSLTDLFDEKNYAFETFEYSGKKRQTHVYQIGKNRIWGATAAMVHNFLERLRVAWNGGNF